MKLHAVDVEEAAHRRVLALGKARREMRQKRKARHQQQDDNE